MPFILWQRLILSRAKSVKNNFDHFHLHTKFGSFRPVKLKCLNVVDCDYPGRPYYVNVTRRMESSNQILACHSSAFQLSVTTISVKCLIKPQKLGKISEIIPSNPKTGYIG